MVRIVSIFSIVLLLVCKSESSNAQKLKLTSTDYIGGTHWGVSIAHSIPTKDKGLVMCGQTRDSGSADIPRALHVPNDSGDVVVIKLDSFGKKQWVKVYGTTAPEGAKAICQTPDGGYAVLTGSNKRMGDIAFDRLDANGNFLWSSPNIGSSGQEGISEIIATPDNGFLISGISLGADGDIPFNYKMPISAFQPADWLLVKTDSLGKKQWVKILGTSGDDSYGRINILSDGTYYYLLAAAVTKDHDCVDPVRKQQAYAGNSPYIIKLDGAGNKIWSKAYGGGYMQRAFFDPRDSSIVGVGDGGNSFEFQGNHGSEDIFMFKVSRDGVFLWGKFYGDQYYDLANSAGINMAPNGGYYLGGTTNSIMNPAPYPHIGGNDSWVFHTDSVGNVLTESLFGSPLQNGSTGSGEDDIVGFMQTKNGIAVVGNSSGYEFTDGTGHNYQFGGGITVRSNAYVAHFQELPTGVEVRNWVEKLKVYPNPAHRQVTVDVPYGLSGTVRCIDASGRVVYRKGISAAQKEFPINTDTWTPGAYIILWQSNNGKSKASSKLLVQ
jgi:hypothetical protein